MVAANTLNKQLRTADKEWSSSLGGGPPAWGLGEVLITPHLKKLPCYETLHKASDHD
jgi:hypothetical protein